MRFYVATSNAGKLRDFIAAAGEEASLEPLPGLAAIAPPSEDAETFEGNAQAKAIYYSTYAPGAIVVADDSGLEVDALHGAPGVRSARYAEDSGYAGASGESLDERNNASLLSALNRMPEGPWAARYRCVLAAARDGQLLHTAEGIVHGEILAAPQGNGGFGYDPLFYLPSYRKTMAELDVASKLSFSHRGHALRNLLPALVSLQKP